MFAWALGLFGMTFSLLIFGAQSQELMSAIKFHINKPFGIDGSLGSFVPILQNILDIPLRMAPRNGIHGFDSDLGGLATTAITWLWFPIALGVIGLILRKQRGVGYPNAGDLFVLCHVAAHKIFGRDGSHLTVRLPITFAEAALGADIEVPTLSGEAVTLRLKAGTQSGSRHRVKGKGIASVKTTGDLIVSVDVVVPTELTDDQKDAVVAFAKASDGSPRDTVFEQAKQSKRAAS